KDTIVVLTADHGEELRGERGYESHGYGATETLLHTPLFVRVPGVEAGVRGDPVSGVDVLPTLLEALGVQCAYPMHGRSLLREGQPSRATYGSSLFPSPAVSKALIYSDIHAMYDGPWKLIHDRGENA